MSLGCLSRVPIYQSRVFVQSPDSPDCQLSVRPEGVCQESRLSAADGVCPEVCVQIPEYQLRTKKITNYAGQTPFGNGQTPFMNGQTPFWAILVDKHPCGTNTLCVQISQPRRDFFVEIFIASL